MTGNHNRFVDDWLDSDGVCSAEGMDVVGYNKEKGGGIRKRDKSKTAEIEALVLPQHQQEYTVCTVNEITQDESESIISAGFDKVTETLSTVANDPSYANIVASALLICIGGWLCDCICDGKMRIVGTCFTRSECIYETCMCCPGCVANCCCDMARLKKNADLGRLRRKYRSLDEEEVVAKYETAPLVLEMKRESLQMEKESLQMEKESLKVINRIRRKKVALYEKIETSLDSELDLAVSQGVLPTTDNVKTRREYLRQEADRMKEGLFRRRKNEDDADASIASSSVVST